jgi:creatinine amidohydrolase
MTRIASLAWDEIERRLAEGRSAILPIGAAAKEHGLHLPMNTDEIQALWLADKLAEKTGALIWPAVTYGFYPAFTDFPGSITLSRETFIAMIRDIVTGIKQHGAHRIFILDTGISTIAPVSEAIAGQEDVTHLRIHEGPAYRAAADSLREQTFGSHADELETSRMLAIAPEQVNMSRAAATPKGPIEGPLTRTNAPSGSYGDPTLATKAKGEKLIAAMLEDLLAAMKDYINRTA